MLKKILVGLSVVIVGLLAAATLMLTARHEAYPDTDAFDRPELPSVVLSESFRQDLDAWLKAYRTEHNIPSVAVALGLNGELAYAATAGYARLEDRVPATIDSLYRIGSVSKSITAVALGDLMAEGKIDIKAPFHQYVPDFPAKAWPFSLHQLASHTAGIRHYRPGPIDSLRENYNDTHFETVHASLTLVADDPLGFEPGTGFLYSSYGYNMLSAAMSAAADQPFVALLDKAVFKPAAMGTAQAENVLDPHPDTVGYYLQLGDYAIRSPDADNSYKIAGGGIIATPAQLVAFGNALLGGRLISDRVRAELFTPVPLASGEMNPQNYALGFRVFERTLGGVDVKEVSHGGSSVGGVTSFLMFPGMPTATGRPTNLVVAVAINISPLYSEASPHTVAYALAERVIGYLN